MYVKQAGGSGTCRTDPVTGSQCPTSLSPSSGHVPLQQAPRYEPVCLPVRPRGRLLTSPGVGVRRPSRDSPSMFRHFCRTSYTSRSAGEGGRPSIRGGRQGLPHASECRPRHATLSRARPTTSCAFINDLLDLGLLRCALSGLFGWWGWCIGSCLGFNPHVCVNFFVGVLLLWTGKAGDEVMVIS